METNRLWEHYKNDGDSNFKIRSYEVVVAIWLFMSCKFYISIQNIKRIDIYTPQYST